MTDKGIIEELKRTNPKEYIRLCEATGQKKKAQDYALRYYSKSRDALEICTAAEIALELGKNNLVKILADRARNTVDEEMARERRDVYAISRDPEGRGMMGAAMCYWGTEEKQKIVYEKVSEIKKSLGRKR